MSNLPLCRASAAYVGGVACAFRPWHPDCAPGCAGPMHFDSDTGLPHPSLAHIPPPIGIAWVLGPLRKVSFCHLAVSTLQPTRRQTRSGAAYSPWVQDWAPLPLYAPDDFELAAHVQAAVEAESAQLDDALSGDDIDDLPIEDPSIIQGAPDTALPSGSTEGAADDASTSNPLPPAPFLNPSPAPPPDPLPIPSAHSPPIVNAAVATIPTPATPNIAASKKQLHSRKHFKERRKAARMRHHNEVHGETPSNSPIKSVALKRRSAALALKLSIRAEEDVLSAMAGDGAATQTEDAAPIETDFSLNMGDVPVARTAFVGKRLEPDEDGRHLWSRDRLIQEEGFQLVEWDGM